MCLSPSLLFPSQVTTASPMLPLVTYSLARRAPYPSGKALENEIHTSLFGLFWASAHLHKWLVFFLPLFFSPQDTVKKWDLGCMGCRQGGTWGPRMCDMKRNPMKIFAFAGGPSLKSKTTMKNSDCISFENLFQEISYWQ